MTTPEQEQLRKDIEAAGPDALAERIVEAAAAAASDITLSNGIVLRAKSFPRAVLRTALAAVPDPKVPTIHFEDGSDEENPNDPDYLAAWETVHGERLEVAARVILAMGLAIVHVPPGMYPPESDVWVQDLESVGITADVKTPFRRWTQWLNLYAIPSETERVTVWFIAQRQAGMTEQEVIAAMRYFQDLAVRRTPDDSSVAPGAGANAVGDRVRSRDTGPSQRVRGARSRAP